MKAVPATCQCGHEGKSLYPQFYQCADCYYTARAASNERRAVELRERALRLEIQAQAFRAKAKAFRKRRK